MSDPTRLTRASEKLLNDFDRWPDAIDHSELSARLWLIEREAAALSTPSLDDLRAKVDAITYAPGANNHEWRRGVQFAKDRVLRLIEAEAAALSTTPASLDAERLARAYLNVTRSRPEFAMLPDLDDVPAAMRAESIADAAEVAAEYDRLAREYAKP